MSEQGFPETVIELAGWMFNPHLVGMGGERQFDYAQEGSRIEDRLGRCYELAAKAFAGWEMFNRSLLATNSVTLLPEPATLIHGTWQGPGAEQPIHHAFVMLSDDRIWEPISMMICDLTLFKAYTNPKWHTFYTSAQVQRNMIQHGHFGPWEGD